MSRPKRKTKFIVAFSVILLVLAIVGGVVLFNTLKANNSTVQTGVQPNFRAVLPASTSIEDLGGWQKLTPPNSDPFYVYIDEIDSILVNVSQQSLPSGFSSDVDTKVSEVAKGYNATSTLDANGTKVYIGNSAKGPQSVIFSKNGLLILIVSQQKIQDESWISYINSLK